MGRYIHAPIVLFSLVLPFALGCLGDTGSEGPITSEERYDLSACGERLLRRYEGTAYVMLHRWKNVDRFDTLVTSHPQWHGCGSDVKRAADGLGDDAYVYDRPLGLVFRPDLPPPPDTVPLRSFLPPAGSVIDPADFDEYASTDGLYEDGDPWRVEGFVYPPDWRPPPPPSGVIDMFFIERTEGGLLDRALGTDPSVDPEFTYVLRDGYLIDPEMVSQLRPGECLRHEDCATSQLCVLDAGLTGPGEGRRGTCQRRCRTHRDCGDDAAPRCDPQLQRCVSPRLRYDDTAATTFTRGTGGSYLDGPTRIRWADRDILRWEDRGDGFGPQPLFEGEGTNLVASSADWLDTSWTEDGATLLAVVKGPDESRRGGFLEASLDDGRFQSSFDSPSGLDVTVSTWLRMGLSGSTAGRLIATDPSASEHVQTFSIRREWARYSFLASLGAGTSVVGVAMPSAGDDLMAFGLQCEPSPFPTSYIRTGTSLDAVRAADSLAFDEVDPSMASHGFSIDVWPYAASHELPLHERHYLVEIDAPGGTGAGIALRQSLGATVLEIVGAGCAVDVSFERHQRLRVIVSPVDGFLEVRGASNGDPLQSSCGFWEWPAGVPWYFGGGPDNELFGRLSEPYETVVISCDEDLDCPPDHGCSSDRRCFPRCSVGDACPGGRSCVVDGGVCEAI